MTARIVIYSTLAARPNYSASFHRESIPGIPACGVPLRNPHRAIAVDDERLCASCWGDVIHSLGTSSRVSDDLGRIGTTPADAPTSHRSLTKSTPVSAKRRGK